MEWRLIGWVAVLTLVNRMAATVIITPQMVLTQMLEHFGTDQVAWLNSGRMSTTWRCVTWDPAPSARCRSPSRREPEAVGMVAEPTGIGGLIDARP
jgi:hypothetical protein